LSKRAEVERARDANVHAAFHERGLIFDARRARVKAIVVEVYNDERRAHPSAAHARKNGAGAHRNRTTADLLRPANQCAVFGVSPRWLPG